MLYNYSDVSKLFETINNKIKNPGDYAYVDGLGYVHHYEAYSALAHLLDGGMTVEDYIFVHNGINCINQQPKLNVYSAFSGYNPVDLKEVYHIMVYLFGGNEVAELIGSKNIFGKAYCNAMKRCNKSTTELYAIPTAKLVFEEFSKLLKRMMYNGSVIDDDEIRQYIH